MKCEKCSRVVNDGGYEYPCYVCAIFGEKTPKQLELENDCGCKIHYKELDKLLKIKDEIDGLQWYGIEAYEKGRPLNAKEEVERERLHNVIEEYKAYMEHLIKKYEVIDNDIKGI